FFRLYRISLNGRGGFSPPALQEPQSPPLSYFYSGPYFAVELGEVVVHRPQRKQYDNPEHGTARAIGQCSESIYGHLSVESSCLYYMRGFEERSKRNVRLDVGRRL